MGSDPTMFVAMPMSELEELIRSSLRGELKAIGVLKPQTQTEELMSMDETCQFLRVSKVTIHKWKKRRLIFSHRIGRKIYFKKQELVEAMNSFSKAKK